MKVGFCHGCFDLLHEGHLHFLQRASQACDYLIVAVNNDDSVVRLKGPMRPVHSLDERIGQMLARASAWIEAVIPFDGAKGILLMQIKPDVYIHGYDQPLTRQMRWYLEQADCTSVQVPHLVGHSTSLQIEAARSKTNA